MPSIAIVGWTGLVGQNLVTQLSQSDIDLYNSRNIHSLSGKTYDTIYFCAMPAEKWRINKNPDTDYTTLITLQDILKTVAASKFILISTVDIFDCTVEQNEDGTAYAEHPYGRHRRLLEDFIKTQFGNSYIIRLPGLFGWGLKKNILYDLINNNQVSNISLASKFQWYCLDDLIGDISNCISNNIHTIQLVSEPISVNTIVSRFFPEKMPECSGTTVTEYKLITSHGSRAPYWTSEEYILGKMKDFIARENTLIKLPYRLSVSNIAWNHDDTVDIIKVLRSFHISSIELAPTKVCKWDEWSADTISSMKMHGIPYTSCQSILYNTDIKIFEEPTAFIAHYEKVCSICKDLGIKYIVFGSPSARHLTTDCNPIGLFKEIGFISSKYDIICCIEPNSTKYGCTWLTTLKDVHSFIMQVDHPNIRINFDFGNYYMENDTTNIAEVTPYISHMQISMPYLDALSSITSDIFNKYREIVCIVNHLSYSKNISLEMRNSDVLNFCKSLYRFAKLM